MASVLPPGKLPRIQWMEARIESWQSAGPTIGLSIAEITILAEKVKDARETFDNAVKLKAQAKDGTLSSDDDARQMSTLAAAAIAKIKAFALTSSNPDAVFAAASVPPPSSGGGSTLPPAQPGNFSFDLDTNTGGLIVRWRCTNPSGVSGVVYNVRRSIGSAPLTLVGVTGEKKFIDTAIPAGSSSITYQVFGQRGSQTGVASNPVTVRFGGGGTMMVFEHGADGEASTNNEKLAA